MEKVGSATILKEVVDFDVAGEYFCDYEAQNVSCTYRAHQHTVQSNLHGFHLLPTDVCFS